MLNAPRVPLERLSFQLCRVKNIVEMIYSYEKSCCGFGSITQVMGLGQVWAEAITHVRRHAPVSTELPEGFKSGRFIGPACRASVGAKGL